jgi:hypothetical protein
MKKLVDRAKDSDYTRRVLAATDPAPLATPLALGDLVASSASWRARMHRGGCGWLGVILAFIEVRGQTLALCGQRPEACDCHINRGNERPETSDPACLSCAGDGEARWRAWPLADLARADDPRPHRALTRTLPPLALR